MNIANRIVINFQASIARNENKKVELRLEKVHGFHHTLDVDVSKFQTDSIVKLVKLAKMYACYLTHETIEPPLYGDTPLGKTPKTIILRVHFELAT